MSEITNAEINKKAAEMVGHVAERRTKDRLGSYVMAPATGDTVRVYVDCVGRTFDISATTPQGAADREAVVIALGEKHHTDILSCSDSNSNHTGWRSYNWMRDNESKTYKTRTEALSAAVQAVK